MVLRQRSHLPTDNGGQLLVYNLTIRDMFPMERNLYAVERNSFNGIGCRTEIEHIEWIYAHRSA